VSLTGPFSIFHRAILNLPADAAGGFAVNTRVAPVPEPASLILIGSGLGSCCPHATTATPIVEPRKPLAVTVPDRLRAAF
jgi:hypothetical protein